MEIQVRVIADKEEEERLEVANDATYETVLETLTINPEEVVVLCNGKPVPDDEPVAEKTAARAEITIIRIISVG